MLTNKNNYLKLNQFMKLSVLLSALLFIGFSNSIDAQKKVAGVDFPAVMKVNKKVVTFNGGGLREKYTIDLYVVGLYLRKPSMSSEKVLNSTDEMAMRIKIVSSKVTRDKFVESVKEGFVKSPGATKENIKDFMKFYADPFKKGDEILLVYKPGFGTVFYKNKEKRGVISGAKFKKALFGIWLGDKPADKKLKLKLLGKI